MDYLLFTLYGPMTAFGGVAVGINRTSWSTPSKSAVLGLVASSMGIPRTQEEKHLALQDAIGFAVRTDAPGRTIEDYHTVQVPPRRKGNAFATRQEELEAPRLNTIVSKREWLCDAFFTVGLWNTPEAPGAYHIASIRDALKTPVFAPYLGRKAAAPALPFRPEIHRADCVEAAFAVRQHPGIERRIIEPILPDGTFKPPIAVEGDSGRETAETRIEKRRDRIVSRVRWQFADREEAIHGEQR